jgi:hypothetical protein
LGYIEELKISVEIQKSETKEEILLTAATGSRAE